MGEVIKMINGLDNDIKKTANIFMATKYCERLWYDANEIDEECNGIYLVHGEDDLEYMSPFLDLPTTSPHILNQINCLEQFFEVVSESPIVKPRQDVLKTLVNEWDGVIPEDVKPFENAVTILKL